MNMPVIVVASGGLPVQESTTGTGLPLVEATSGALPVTLVDVGGVPCLDPLGTIFSAFSLTAPVATWVSAASVAQATFDLLIPLGVVAGDKVWGESSLDNFATVLETVSAAISGGDLIDLEIETFAFSPFADGLTYVRFWISNSADVQISPKSNIISETIAAASANGHLYPLLLAA